jgi:hypothetical protein
LSDQWPDVLFGQAAVAHTVLNKGILLVEHLTTVIGFPI